MFCGAKIRIYLLICKFRPDFFENFSLRNKLVLCMSFSSCLWYYAKRGHPERAASVISIADGNYSPID